MMEKKGPERIFLSPPHMGGDEMRFVQKAFESNYIAPLGPQVDEFEREFSKYVGIPYVLAVSSGTAAIHLALCLLNVELGDEIIVSTLTFIGSVTPAIFQGAQLTFVDCDPGSWNMSPKLLKEALEDCKRRGKSPKVVIPTDLYGQCFDYEKILKICKDYNVPVIADAAEAMGSKYRYLGDKNIGLDRGGIRWLHAGKGAKAAIFSFNGNKIITTSGGGMLASDDKEFIDRARFLSQQAKESVPYYEHKEIGYNYRMSNILAGIGRGQLRVLDERVRRKREIFKYYQKALENLPGIEFMPEPEWSRSSRWLTVILISPEEFGVDREKVRLALEIENIEARPVWKPMHLQPVFRVKEQNTKQKQRTRVVGGEISEYLFDRGLCLPSGTAMLNSDVDRVIEIILKCHKNS